MRWNAEAFFLAAGGATALRRLLIEAGFDPPEIDTIYVWRSRRQIPHVWVPNCIFVLLLAGKAKLSDLIERVEVGP